MTINSSKANDKIDLYFRYGHPISIEFPDGGAMDAFVLPGVDLDGEFKCMCMDEKKLFLVHGHNAYIREYEDA
tara:strand:- start:452 stop:670 length:219 start_codon:yes stop_codon:yes gene_type:complete